MHKRSQFSEGSPEALPEASLLDYSLVGRSISKSNKNVETLVLQCAGQIAVEKDFIAY